MFKMYKSTRTKELGKRMTEITFLKVVEQMEEWKWTQQSPLNY
jgi:hypothetical protein